MGRGLMLIVSGLVIVVGISKINMSSQIETLPEKITDYYYEQQARNISISLVDEAVQKLLDNNDWSGTIEMDTSIFRGRGSLTTYDQNSIGNLSDSVTVGNWDQYTVVLFSEATYEDYTVATEVLMSRDSYSKYSYFTNTQPSNIWFMSRDTLSGPVHTNGTFRIAGNPIFNGLVTSPTSWIGHSSYSNNPQFNGGSNFNAPNKSFNLSSQVTDLKNSASSGGLTFNERVRIELLADGTADISKVCGSVWCTAVNYDLTTTNGIISNTQRIDIKGVTNGQLTIQSDSHIEILGDLTYNDDPIANPNSTDFLGLVSSGDVRVDVNAHTDTGSKDVTLQASIMALGSSFYVENASSYSPRGTINLLGGLIQETRGQVSTFNSSGIVTGYAKDYQYDERLRYNVPPSFPREKVFSILHWKDKLIERPTNSGN